MDERIRKRVRFAYKVFLLPIWECSKIVWNELDSSRRGWWNAGRWEQFTLKTRKPSAGFFLERFLVFTDMSSMALNPSVLTVLPVPALIRAAESQPPNWPPCHQPFPSPSTLPHTQDFLRMIMSVSCFNILQYLLPYCIEIKPELLSTTHHTIHDLAHASFSGFTLECLCKPLTPPCLPCHRETEWLTVSQTCCALLCPCVIVQRGLSFWNILFTSFFSWLSPTGFWRSFLEAPGPC